jgi:uncharacterized protein (DUF39 family)
MNSDSDINHDIMDTSVENRTSQVRLSHLLENSLYLEIDTECQQCEKKLREEELFSGFTKSLNQYTIKCPACKSMFVPKLMVYSEYKTDYLKGREGVSVTLLSPIILYKEYINIIE